MKDKTVYIAYRGTDSTFVGWKEDLNMAFVSPIPSQEEGVVYLNTIAEFIPGTLKLRTGGHSKGGNIAVYSAMNCNTSVRDRIIGVFDHDGPGFKNSVFQSTEFVEIKDRIHKTMPQSSIIGMLLEHQENYSVVESKRFGIMQHDPFSWSVVNGDFNYTKNITSGAMHMHRTLNQWLDTLSNEKRKLFVDTLFQVIESTNAESIYEFSDDWKKGAITLLGAVKNIDMETKRFVSRTINELVKLSFKNLHNSEK